MKAQYQITQACFAGKIERQVGEIVELDVAEGKILIGCNKAVAYTAPATPAPTEASTVATAEAAEPEKKPKKEKKQ